MFWTTEREKLLRKYIEVDGFSHTRAAALLGCSRNSTIGKAQRMKLKSNHINSVNAQNKIKPEKQKTKPVTKSVKKRKRRRIRLPPEFHDNDVLFFSIIAILKPRSSSTIIDIPGKFECKWIDGDVRDRKATWCRKYVVGNTSWCLHHYHRVYDVGRARITRK